MYADDLAKRQAEIQKMKQRDQGAEGKPDGGMYGPSVCDHVAI